MTKTPEETPEETDETGISMEKIQELQRERKRKEAEKRKNMGCWDCGKKLTTWDYPLGVVHIGTNLRLKLMKKKIAGEAYLCYSCYCEADADKETIQHGKCFFCGKEESVPRGCGVSICETCMEPVGDHITDITSHGDGSMSKDEEINLVRDWWFAGRGLLSCLMELEMFQRTENVKRLRELREELLEEQRIGIITEEEQNHILELMNDVVKETQKEDGEPVEMAAGLYGAIEGLMMKSLYHNHPLKKADIQLEPGIYELEGKRPEGLDTFRWTVSDAPVVLRRIPNQTSDEQPEARATGDGDS